MADHLGDTVRLLTRALMDTNREGAAACLASMLERLAASDSPMPSAWPAVLDETVRDEQAAGAAKAPGHCASCRHWDAEPYAESPHVRRCKRVPQWWDATTWDEDTFDRVLTAAERDTLAFANDGSCYGATLLTRPTFGCVMHEARPA